MRLPVVAIVGRPNVGKSTLFNRLTSSRKAIVRDTPGVTRDRIHGTCEFGGWRATVIDTGGLDPTSDEPLTAQVRKQVLAAIAVADALVFVVDGREGLTPFDQEVARLLRRVAKPVVVAVNKVDAKGRVTAAADVALSVTGAVWSVLTDGNVAAPELIFTSGDVVMTHSP